MSTLVPIGVGALLGGVRVLAALNTSSNANDRLYRVQHLCCGAEVEMSHEIIRRRARQNLTRCAACGRSDGGKASVRVRLQKPQTPGFRVIDEMPINERPTATSAAEILALWNRANARVTARTGARG